MAKIIQLGQPPIEVQVKHSSRARRMSLRISGADGRVSLTLPRGAHAEEANAFLQAKEHWMRKHLLVRPARTDVDIGAMIPIEGRSRLVREGPGKQVRLLEDAIVAPSSSPGPRIRAYLKALARDRLAEASDRHASALGRPYGKLTLRDTRSRWGSCSTEGNLMYSWRLILAPREVLDYVAAHEVAHLAEMNHSARYWAGVARLCPGYERPRRWLKSNGAELHRYVF